MSDAVFSVYYHPILKKKCLEWVGSYELCDICGKCYRMINVNFHISGQFVCWECAQQPILPKETGGGGDDDDPDLIHECDCCHDFVGISEMIIQGNSLLCPECAQETPYQPFGWG